MATKSERKQVVIDLGVSLAESSLEGCRAKYAMSSQRAAIDGVIDELKNGTLYLGDWGKGEIQIIGLHCIVVTPYWVMPVYTVLFPPRKEWDVPAVGTYQAIRWNVGLQSGAATLLRTVRGEFVMLRSFKHAKRAWTIELPRGTRRPDETLERCAIREAQEEVGAILTETSKVIPLGVIDVDTGALAQNPEIFMITDVVIDESRVSRDVSESEFGLVILDLFKLYDMVRDRKITDAWAATALMRAQLKGLIDPPRILPTGGLKTVKTFKEGWYGTGYHYVLEANVLENGEVVTTLHPEDWVGAPPSFRGILDDDLARIVRYLKRPSRRKNGFWRTEVGVIHGYAFSLEGGGGFIKQLKFDFKEREDALKVAAMLEQIDAERRRVAAEWFQTRRARGLD